MSALNEAFIEVVRINPDPEGTEVLLKRKYVRLYSIGSNHTDMHVPQVLIHEGVNESSNVPRSVGDIRLGEVMPRESLGNEAAGDIVVDFFSAVDFMHIVRNAMIDTAVDRECREDYCLITCALTHSSPFYNLLCQPIFFTLLPTSCRRKQSLTFLLSYNFY
ncbi:hypothetical protein LIPSTDRAFT_70413 [Lipomyces starkeyi NRRL Y-11557]|uniref:Uncharacterized protein n=1 Tax=Lipomyces starkeyi NRRL Y-11557 TaxID=675824 RepID=A0A1E3Q6V8_LIPST|nr:hypothetical protein LIPSTDRAFT_70413 [Lipomyces starkeyi NRRL Y-11557]